MQTELCRLTYYLDKIALLHCSQLRLSSLLQIPQCRSQLQLPNICLSLQPLLPHRTVVISANVPFAAAGTARQPNIGQVAASEHVHSCSYCYQAIHDTTVVTSQMCPLMQLVQPDSPTQDRLQYLNMCIVLQQVLQDCPREIRLRHLNMCLFSQLLLLSVQDMTVATPPYVLS